MLILRSIHVSTNESLFVRVWRWLQVVLNLNGINWLINKKKLRDNIKYLKTSEKYDINLLLMALID